VSSAETDIIAIQARRLQVILAHFSEAPPQTGGHPVLESPHGNCREIGDLPLWECHNRAAARPVSGRDRVLFSRSGPGQQAVLRLSTHGRVKKSSVAQPFRAAGGRDAGLTASAEATVVRRSLGEGGRPALQEAASRFFHSPTLVEQRWTSASGLLSPVLFPRKSVVDRIGPRRLVSYRRGMGSPLVSCRAGLIMLSVLIVSPCSLEAQTTSQSSLPPTATQAAVPATRVFGSDAAIVLNFIRADTAA
jgi:hypothetical protein